MNKTILMLLALCLPCSAFAAGTTYYLKLPGIEGESQRVDHEGEIDVRAISWNVSSNGRATCIDDLLIIKQVDLSSPGLLMGQVQGTVYRDGVLSARRDSGDSSFDFLVIRMSNVQVTSLSTDGSVGDPGLTEKVTLSFEKARYEYTRVNEDHSPGETSTAEVFPGVRCR